MAFTYTYTARNKEKPHRAVTFTIYDDHLKVNLTGLFDQLSEVIDSKNKQGAVKDIVTTQSGTALYKATERMSGPAHINDVTPVFKNGKLVVTFWNRLAGLRTAPVVVMMGDVDNPEAAEQFVETLTDRQKSFDKPGVFAGPLDYWFTWFAMLIGVIVLIRWPKKRKTE